MIKLGIYVRKSIYRDNSDSIAVQIKCCKEYASLIYKDEEIEYKIYDKDEGFSGKNTERPSYQEMMNDVRANKLDVIMVYKLDRISRSVKDFSETYETMNTHNVTFMSVKEAFDTSTPIGRTVMYILAAFAQLERETTSERVTDNMYALGASGKWTGGKTPAGMSVIRKVIGEKEHSYLIVDHERIKTVKLLAELLLSGNSITKIERYCRDNGIKSESGKFLNTSQIHFILTNPVYCGNDLDAYYYFKENNYKLPEKEQFDGRHGLIAYGRTDQSGEQSKKGNPSIGIGVHEPVFSGKEWISLQERFGKNKMFRTAKYEIGILKGVLKCECGSRMDIRTYIHNGNLFSYYYCAQMHRQGKEYCDSGYTRVEKIDQLFIEKLKEIQLAPENILVKESNALPVSIDKLQNDLTATMEAIKNLTNALEENASSTATPYIITRIESLDKEKLRLETAIKKAELTLSCQKNAKETQEQIYNNICSLLNNFEEMSYREKNELIKNTVKSCVFAENHLTIIF